MRFICNIIIALVMLIIASSCAKIQLKPEINKNYKMDIGIKTKDREGSGMLVLQSKPIHQIEFEAEEKIGFISFRTCSREITAEDPRVGLSRKKYAITYKPNEIELEDNCPVLLSAFNDTRLYSVGFIDFQGINTTLSALSICGGKTEQNIGVSVCQERVSSIERIKFDTEVLTSPDPGCELESGNKGKEFTYKVKPGFCTHAFMTTERPYRVHRLTVFGYEDIQVRR